MNGMLTRFMPFAILLALALPGCVGTPPPKPPFMQEGIAAKILLDKTTADEVEQLLGRPQQIERVNESGTAAMVWIYQFVQTGVNELIPALRETYNRPALHSLLRITFDSGRIVRKTERIDRDLRSESEGQVIVPF